MTHRLALTAALLCLGATAARAERREPPGRAALREAVALMAEERCDEAIPLLRRAFEVGRQRNALWNMAQCYGLLGRPGLAIETYRRYLEDPRTRASASDQRAAREAIAQLERSVAPVEFIANVEGAQVRLDGQDLGVTPLTALVGEGLHVVEITSAGFDAMRREVQITAGEARRIEAELELLPGTLEVRSEPESAALLLDGEPVGAAPRRLQVSGGTHLLEATAPGRRPLRRRVHIDPAEQVEVLLELPALRGTLALSGADRGASLSIDGRPAGTAPFDPIALPPGRFHLEVSAPRRATWSDDVEVLDARTTVVELHLAERGGLHQGWFWSTAGLAVASAVTGGALLVFGQLLAQDQNAIVEQLATGGEGTRDLVARQAESDRLADRAVAFSAAGIALLTAALGAAVAALVLAFRTQFREAPSTAEVRTEPEAPDRDGVAMEGSP